MAELQGCLSLSRVSVCAEDTLLSSNLGDPSLSPLCGMHLIAVWSFSQETFSLPTFAFPVSWRSPQGRDHVLVYLSLSGTSGTGNKDPGCTKSSFWPTLLAQILIFWVNRNQSVIINTSDQEDVIKFRMLCITEMNRTGCLSGIGSCPCSTK